MALWDVDGEIVYTEGSLSLTPEQAGGIFVTRHSYKIPYSNTGRGGFLTNERGTFHTPSWIQVHPQTSFEDLEVEKKPFEELFVEEKKWEFKSGSSDKVYTVKHNKRGELSCDCMGYIGHRKCKHITEVKLKL
jgi:hypothetical protein